MDNLLVEIVPIENARMKKRTVIEWDKDDLDTLGILKVDILALGILTCIRKAFDEIKEYLNSLEKPEFTLNEKVSDRTIVTTIILIFLINS